MLTTPTTFKERRHVGAGDLPRGACGWVTSISVWGASGQAHLDVAGAGRHVDEEVVEWAPLHIGEELFDRLG
jgi:hypothetical protein